MASDLDVKLTTKANENDNYDDINVDVDIESMASDLDAVKITRKANVLESKNTAEINLEAETIALESKEKRSALKSVSNQVPKLSLNLNFDKTKLAGLLGHTDSCIGPSENLLACNMTKDALGLRPELSSDANSSGCITGRVAVLIEKTAKSKVTNTCLDKTLPNIGLKKDNVGKTEIKASLALDSGLKRQPSCHLSKNFENVEETKTTSKDLKKDSDQVKVDDYKENETMKNENVKDKKKSKMKTNDYDENETMKNDEKLNTNIFKKMMMKTKVIKQETPERKTNLKSRMKKETPRKRAMKRFKNNENVTDGEKSELLMMFEKLEKKKMLKKENEKVKTMKNYENDEKEKSTKINENDEKMNICKDEKNETNYENKIEKSNKLIEKKKEKDKKKVDMKTERKMKKVHLNENLNSEIKIGLPGQKPDQTRTFRPVSRPINQFVGPCSLTTKPTEVKDMENISRSSLSETKTEVINYRRLQRNESNSTVTSHNDSNRKRKFSTMDSMKLSNKVQQLIGELEVGKRTKLDKS